MVHIELKNHPVWHDLAEIFKALDSDALVKEHLEKCNYKVHGYWDDHDQYYDEVILPRPLKAELTSSSVCMAQAKRSLNLNFILKAVDMDNAVESDSKRLQKIGELRLVYDDNLEFVDENWWLDVESSLLQEFKVNL